MARKPTIKTCPYQNNPAEYPFGLIQVRRWSRFLASETAPIGSVRPHCRLEARVGPCPSNQSAAGKNRDLAKAAAAAVAVLAGVVQGGMDLHLGHSDGAWGAHRAPSARASGLLMHVPDNRGPDTSTFFTTSPPVLCHSSKHVCTPRHLALHGFTNSRGVRLPGTPHPLNQCRRGLGYQVLPPFLNKGFRLAGAPPFLQKRNQATR